MLGTRTLFKEAFSRERVKEVVNTTASDRAQRGSCKMGETMGQASLMMASLSSAVRVTCRTTWKRESKRSDPTCRPSTCSEVHTTHHHQPPIHSRYTAAGQVCCTNITKPPLKDNIKIPGQTPPTPWRCERLTQYTFRRHFV